MTTLIFNVDIEQTLSQILLAIRPYMKGLSYSTIQVRSAGKTRIMMERTELGYKVFGCVLTPEKITRRYTDAA